MAASQRDLEAVQRNMDSLLAWMGQVEYDKIDRCYHVTTCESKQEIVQKGEIHANLANVKYGQLPSAIHERVNGVLFTCNFVENVNDPGTIFGDGAKRLPTKSPHGTERIQIPITYFTARHNMHMFYDMSYNVGGQRYVVLVLVSEGDPDYQFCQENMISLEMTTNPFLRLDPNNNQYKCCYRRSLWVELFVVGPVPIPVWDEVEMNDKCAMHSSEVGET